MALSIPPDTMARLLRFQAMSDRFAVESVGNRDLEFGRGAVVTLETKQAYRSQYTDDVRNGT